MLSATKIYQIKTANKFN